MSEGATGTDGGCCKFHAHFNIIMLSLSHMIHAAGASPTDFALVSPRPTYRYAFPNAGFSQYTLASNSADFTINNSTVAADLGVDSCSPRTIWLTMHLNVSGCGSAVRITLSSVALCMDCCTQSPLTPSHVSAGGLRSSVSTPLPA